MSGSVSGGAEGQLRAAARLARSAPSATLREVSGLVHVDERSLRRCLRQLPRRGRCAELASNTAASRNTAAIHAHRAVPPPVLRALEPADAAHTLTGLVAPGTAMWASRDVHALVEASLRPMIGDGLADADTLTPACGAGPISATQQLGESSDACAEQELPAADADPIRGCRRRVDACRCRR